MTNKGSQRRIEGVGEVALDVTTRYACPAHFHETYTFEVITGPATLHCRGRSWEVRGGEVTALDPREVHWGGADARNCQQVIFYPAPDYLAELFGSSEPGHFTHPVIEDPALAAQLSEALLCAEEAPSLLRDATLALFTKHADLSVAPASSPSGSNKQQRVGWPLNDALLTSVSQASQSAGVSAAYFSRRFRALFGLNFSDFRRQQRVCAARAAIERGEALSQCALEAGFSDQAHMTRQVRSILGVTPKALRPPIDK